MYSALFSCFLWVKPGCSIWHDWQEDSHWTGDVEATFPWVLNSTLSQKAGNHEQNKEGVYESEETGSRKWWADPNDYYWSVLWILMTYTCSNPLDLNRMSITLCSYSVGRARICPPSSSPLGNQPSLWGQGTQWPKCVIFNSLLTNDAHMCQGLAISRWALLGGFKTF